MFRKMFAAMLVAAALFVATAVSGFAGEEFKLGVFTQLSGGGAIYGEESINALKMMVQEINDAGGLNGKKVVYVIYDDQGSPEEAVKAVTKLIQVDKVDAVVGSILSTCVLAASGYLNEAKIPTFGTGLSPTWMKKGWEYVFRACVNSDYVMPLTAEIVKDLGIKSVGIFQGQDDSAIATGAGFKKACENLGIKVTAVESYLEGDSDFSGQIAKLINSGAEAFFMSTVGQTYPLFIKQMRLFGYNGVIFNKESLPQDAMEVAGPFANYIAFAAPYLTYKSVDDCDIPNMKAFLTRYQKAYNTLPSTDSAYRTWDSMLVLREAIKIAGSTDKEAIKNAINKVTGLQGLGGTLDYSKGDREGLHSFNKFILIDGKNVTIEKWISTNAYEAWKRETGR